MTIFRHDKPAAELVTTGRFELERDGHVATLLYTLAGHVLGLVETEVPEALHGTGTGSALVKSALDYAREQHLKVDVTCPFVAGYLQKHPEYSDLVLR
jgi:uncharacterized protein